MSLVNERYAAAIVKGQGGRIFVGFFAAKGSKIFWPTNHTKHTKEEAENTGSKAKKNGKG